MKVQIDGVEYAPIEKPTSGTNFIKEAKEVLSKPLLADAQEGWICRRRDGKYVLVDSVSTERICPIMCKSDIGGMDCCGWDGRNHTALDGVKDIISTEPLAEKGTAEWAWQMRKLGHSLKHEKGMLIPITLSQSHDKIWKENIDKYPTGWQLYEPDKEPEQPGVNSLATFITEYDKSLPPHMTNCERNGLAGFCKECEELNSGCPKEPAKEPAPQFEVGQWVEMEGHDAPFQCRIVSFPTDKLVSLRPTGRDYTFETGACQIVRKLKASEVVLDFGAFKGTIAQSENDDESIYVYWCDKPGYHNIIEKTSLEPAMQSTVRQLLDRIEKEKSK
jgi:hypothetical protein